MRKRLLAVLAAMVMVLTMVPATVFGEAQEVEVSFEVYEGEFTVLDDCNNTSTGNGYTYGGCEPGTKIGDKFKEITNVEPYDNQYGTFEGWLEYEVCYIDGKAEFVSIGDTVYSTDDVLSRTVPEYNVVFITKWSGLSMDEYSDSAITEVYGELYGSSQSGPNVVGPTFAFSSNGGTMTFKDLMNGQNNAHNTFDCAIDAGTLETCLGMYPAAFVSADRPGYVHTGWTVYEADNIEFISVEESVAEENGGYPPIGDPDLELFLYDVYTDDAGVKMNTFIGLWYSKIIDTSMTTEELYELGGDGKSYYAVANWSQGVVQTVKVNGKDARLEISEEITTVDPRLANKFNSPDEIKNALKKEAFAADSSFTERGMKIKYMDIVLKILQEDGTWVVATPENFPAGGLEVTIPYPEGSNKNGYKFSVLHMFTHGSKAGEIEVLKPEKKDDGLHVVVTSLSPFAVPYEQADETGHKMGSESGLLALFLMTAAAAGATGGTLMVRRKAKATK